MGSIEGVVDLAASSSRSDVRVRDARTEELDELARLLAEVYGAFRTHLPADAWKATSARSSTCAVGWASRS
jgi:hypothetical protein